MGTGIVFVVLVAIWVAYFVQYWSRRREHLATARSVEAFAEAMRVLEKRPAVRTPAGHRVSSAYAMSPARVVSARPAPRPQVVAKPHLTTPHLTTPSPSRGGAPRMSTPSSDSRPSPRRSGPAHPPDRARSSRGRTPSIQMSPSRAVRGLTLLGSLAATLVIGVLAVFSILLWWAPLLGVAAVVASFLWLRSGVQAEIAARRASRPARGRVRPPAPAPVSSPRPSGQAEEAEEHEVAGSPTTPAEPELIETTSVIAEDETRPDGWQPVPVPPPTYTLKAKAERPAAAPEGTQVAPEAPAATALPADAQGEQEAGRAAAYGT